MRRRSAASALCALGLLAATSRADTLEGDEVWVIHPPGRRADAERVLAFYPGLAERARRLYGRAPEGIVRIHLVESLEKLRRFAAGVSGDAVLGCYAAPNVIALRIDRIRAQDASLRAVLAHEVAHLVTPYVPGGRMPRWLDEGLATLFAEGRSTAAEGYARQLQYRGALPPLSGLDRRFESAAREDEEALDLTAISSTAAAALLERFGERTLRDLLARLEHGHEFRRAFREAAGVSFARFEREWRERLAPHPGHAVLLWIAVSIPALLIAWLVVARVRTPHPAGRTHRP